VGCPYKSQSIFLNFNNYYLLINFAYAHAEYRIGHPWPLDNTILSENKFLGFLGSIYNPHLSKNKTAIIYANDVELEVCPEAALVIA